VFQQFDCSFSFDPLHSTRTKRLVQRSLKSQSMLFPLCWLAITLWTHVTCGLLIFTTNRVIVLCLPHHAGHFPSGRSDRDPFVDGSFFSTSGARSNNSSNCLFRVHSPPFDTEQYSTGSVLKAKRTLFRVGKHQTQSRLGRSTRISVSRLTLRSSLDFSLVCISFYLYTIKLTTFHSITITATPLPFSACFLPFHAFPAKQSERVASIICNSNVGSDFIWT
jgi:hypothetical protein